MANHADEPCAVCGSGDRCGTLHISGSGEPARVHLCTPCFALVAETLAAAVERPGEAARDLHLPERAAAHSPGKPCDVCHGPAGDVTFRVALEAERTSRSHHLCEGCLGWFRDVVEQEAATRPANRRRQRDPGGAAPVDLRYRALCYGLSETDRQLVREAAGHLGHAFENDPVQLGTVEERVYFVAAGSRREAFTLADSLPITERVRVVVVASPEHLQDAADALRHGAADLLAAPLTRQQVTGAFDRLADPLAVRARDEATGLPVHWLRPRFGLPAHLVEVRPPAGERGLDVFLVLRRFLRGHDRIGVANDGSLHVIVYCSDTHIGGIVRRMRRLLGTQYAVTVREHAAPGAVDAGRAWSSGLGRWSSGRAVNRASG